MTMSPKLKFAAAALLSTQLLGCSATMQAIKSDATDLYNKAGEKKDELLAPDTHEQIAEKTGATLAAVKAFDVDCKKVGQEVTAERTSPIYQLENKTYKLACE